MGLFDDFFRRGRAGAQRAKGRQAEPTGQKSAGAPTPSSQSRPSAERAHPQAPQAQRTYTVQSGDTLSEIAQRFYGDAMAYKRIFEANRDILDDPDVIYPGQTLKIP